MNKQIGEIQDLADLSVTCEGVKELEKRLAEVEKKLETFLSQSPASKTDPAPAAAASPKGK